MKPIRSACRTPGACPGYFWLDGLPADHPLANRPLPCNCLLARRAAALKASLLPGYRQMTFEAFQVEDGNRVAFELARTFAADPWGQGWYWLVLIGGSGRGKTHLAAAIVNALLDRGEPAHLEVVPELLDWLRAGYHSQGDDFNRRLAHIKSASVLVLDDLGAERSSGRDGVVSWTDDTLYQIINYRLQAQLPTVFTTNLLLEPTAQCTQTIPPRIASRLQDHQVVRVKAILTGDKRKAARPAGRS